MKIFAITLLSFCLLIPSKNLTAQERLTRVVVLGSSTAAGIGPRNNENAWVNQYRQYVKTLNPLNEVINLAVGGFTTYNVMPVGYIPPSNRPSPDYNHNINAALSYSPDAIIINLPSNDAANNFLIIEQLSNFKIILAKADEHKVPVWITTTQPRNFSLEQRKNLIAIRDSIKLRFGNKVIDFWTDIANIDGTIKSNYVSGDGVHLNDLAHLILKDRVIKMDIISNIKRDEYAGFYDNLSNTKNIKLITSIYPNPIASKVTINCFLKKSGEIKLKIYNIYGQLEQIIVNKNEGKGNYSYTWDLQNFHGKELNPGLYVLKVTLKTADKDINDSRILIIK